MLIAAFMRISMAGCGRFLDTAFIEWLSRLLKQANVRLKTFADNRAAFEQ